MWALNLDDKICWVVVYTMLKIERWNLIKRRLKDLVFGATGKAVFVILIESVAPATAAPPPRPPTTEQDWHPSPTFFDNNRKANGFGASLCLYILTMPESVAKFIDG